MPHGDFSCCCGSVHVRTGALVIGILVIIGGIFGIVGSIFRGFWPDIISCAISILVGGLIVVGDRTERPWCYLPYLVLTAIGLVIYAIVIVLLIIFGITVPKGLEDWFNVDRSQDWETMKAVLRAACFISAGLIFISELFMIWFWTVVYKAYKYMRDVCGVGGGYGSYA